MEITFEAWEYRADNSFAKVPYTFSGDTTDGWNILRDNDLYLSLGKGYRLLKTKFCGICSTDLARRFLPFPLPQIIGHEAVAVDPTNGEEFVVEINDTNTASSDEEKDKFIARGLATHVPGRMVLGIDRLPGCFAPYILVPEQAMVPTRGLAAKTAVLAEPLAAALHAVEVSSPDAHDSIAVLGAGRLGCLLITALDNYRSDKGLAFPITALDLDDSRLSRAKKMGADETFKTREKNLKKLKRGFTIVFEATGSPEGLQWALSLSCKEVHVKSTHGRDFYGFKHITELVVDELSLAPLAAECLQFKWHNESRMNSSIYLSPDVDDKSIPPGYHIFQGTVQEALSFLQSEKPSGGLPRFDIAVTTTIDEMNDVIRPIAGEENSLVRPRGIILYAGSDRKNPLTNFLYGKKIIRTSRCGNLRFAIDVLKSHSGLADRLSSTLICDSYTSSDLPAAYEKAGQPGVMKVIITFPDG